MSPLWGLEELVYRCAIHISPLWGFVGRASRFGSRFIGDARPTGIGVNFIVHYITSNLRYFFNRDRSLFFDLS